MNPDEIPQLTLAEIQLAKEMSTPSGYAKHRLGMKLHPKQSGVLNDLFSKRGSRLCVRCSNNVGKTSVLATVAILYACEIRNAMCVSTAGVYRQVSEQLIPYLKRYSHLYDPNQWKFLDSGIKRYDSSKKLWIDVYTGFSADSEHSFQGFHETSDRPLLMIVDESQGVSAEIFRAAEDRCNPTWFMAMGSPGDPAGTFYDMETSLAKHYTHHKINRFDCLIEDGWWNDRKEIERLIEKHGAGNPFIQSTVYGEFSDIVEDALLSLSEYDRCVEHPPRFMDGPQHAFLDFAAGRDKNVLAFRRGNRITIQRKWVEKDTMSAVGQFLALLTSLKKEQMLEPKNVSGDFDGLGKPMGDRIREMGWPINEFRGNKPPRFDQGYQNQIAECYGELAQKIKTCQIILPDDPDFKAQLLGRKAKRNSSGKLQLEPKEDYKKRAGGSPDECDAVAGCAVAAPNYTMSFADVAEELQASKANPLDGGWIAEEPEYETGGMRRFC